MCVCGREREGEIERVSARERESVPEAFDGQNIFIQGSDLHGYLIHKKAPTPLRPGHSPMEGF